MIRMVELIRLLRLSQMLTSRMPGAVTQSARERRWSMCACVCKERGAEKAYVCVENLLERVRLRRESIKWRDIQTMIVAPIFKLQTSS